MTTGKRIVRILAWLGVFVLQLIMTQVVTFVFSLLLPGAGDLLETQPVLFVIMLGLAFSAGVFLAGWAALKWRWLDRQPRYAARLAGAAAGAYLPLIAALILDNPLEAGNPFFLISIVMSSLGFWLPGWMEWA